MEKGTYQELCKRLYIAAETENRSDAMVCVRKWDIQQACEIIQNMEVKNRELINTVKHLQEKLANKNDRIDAFTSAEQYVMQRRGGLPPHADGLKVRLPEKTEQGIAQYVMLCPERDPAALAALRAYALTTQNSRIRCDIMRWIGEKEETRKEPSLMEIITGDER